MSPPPIRPGSPPTTSAAGAAENPDPSTSPPVVGVQNVFPVPETQDPSGGQEGSAAGGPVVEAMVETNWPKPVNIPRYSKERAELEEAFTDPEQVMDPIAAQRRNRTLRLFTDHIPSGLQAKIDAALVLFETRFGLISSMANFDAYAQAWCELQDSAKEELGRIRETMLGFIQRAAHLTLIEAKEFLYCYYQGGKRFLSEADRQLAQVAIATLEARHNPGPAMCYEYCMHRNDTLCEYGQAYFGQFTLIDLHLMLIKQHPKCGVEIG